MINNTNTAKFGPSGLSQSFVDDGLKSTIQMPKWLSAKGLNLFEYSFGQGVHISTKTAGEIADEVDKYDIELSVHAPYFINFASIEPEKASNSINDILTSLKVLKAFRGSRCIFHAGAEGKQPRVEAFSRTLDMLKQTVEVILQNGYDDMIICPETMGKQAQIGTVDEIVEMCKLAPNIYPCVDFGHVNALTGGGLKTQDDYQKIVDKLFDGLGEIKTKNMHVHFSKIQYGPKGELKHLTFQDEIYGPNFEPFAEVIVKNNLTPHILSESAGTQTEDALTMKNTYLNYLK
ncbi:MAG: TIM barrel protein [Clostridia bacterium]